MKSLKTVALIGAALGAMCVTSALHATATPEELVQLGDNLTPLGAEKAGNAEGTIPAWTGGMTEPPAGWKPEMGYIDPFADEEPLFIIDASNYEQHKDKLNAGLIAMMKQYPETFKLPVYKTHRTFANPQEVYDHTRKIAGQVSLDGGSLNGYTQPGAPFPFPKTGEEAMYNHLLRWYGGIDQCAHWLPVQPDGSYYKVGFCQNVIQAPNMDKLKDDNDLFYIFARYDAPATLIGTIYLVHDTIDKSKGDRRAWIYNAGQRRVRRAPDLAYDNIDDGTEGMRITDDWWGFLGALDRYDWRLVGKKEMYIPYNAYKLSDDNLKYEDMLDKGHMKSDLFRYELHRVWEIEATLKDGMSHVYKTRKFYLDEDSWMVVLADAYDSRDNLWRAYVNPLMQFYNAEVMMQRAFIAHDLISGAFIASQLDNERKKPAIEFNQTGRYAEFQTSAIRRRGIK